MVGGPSSCQTMVCSNDGVVYVCDGTPTGPNQCNPHTFWRYVTPTSTNTALLRSGWTHITAVTAPGGNSVHAVAFDPVTPGHVANCTDSGSIGFSPDYGATWYGGSTGSSRIAKDAPWLGHTNEGWMTCGGIYFDPVVSNKLYFADGIGIWHCDCPQTNKAAVFTSETLNNNEIIVNQIVKVPKGGPLLMGVGDRGLFSISDLTKGTQLQICHSTPCLTATFERFAA